MAPEHARLAVHVSVLNGSITTLWCSKLTQGCQRLAVAFSVFDPTPWQKGRGVKTEAADENGNGSRIGKAAFAFYRGGFIESWETIENKMVSLKVLLIITFFLFIFLTAIWQTS